MGRPECAIPGRSQQRRQQRFSWQWTSLQNYELQPRKEAPDNSTSCRLFASVSSLKQKHSAGQYFFPTASAVSCLHQFLCGFLCSCLDWVPAEPCRCVGLYSSSNSSSRASDATGRKRCHAMRVIAYGRWTSRGVCRRAEKVWITAPRCAALVCCLTFAPICTGPSHV